MVNDELNKRRNAELENQRALDALDARWSAQNLGFGAGFGALMTVGENRERPAGDRDTVFKAALVKAHNSPQCVMKSEVPTERKSDHEIASNRHEQEGRVTNLIKAVHAHGATNWNPFVEQQGGPIAKLRAQVGLGEHGEIFYENGQPLLRISKAA